MTTNPTDVFGAGEHFVARRDELARLAERLDRALAGELSVCLVTGEAGSGKTALLTEFARRAGETETDLVYAIGDCNPRLGTGDPYLPFREILGMLTGDVDGKLAEGAITEQNARRLRDRIQASAGVVAEFGPALVDVFVPGSALAAQIGARLARRLGWIPRQEAGSEFQRSGRAVTWEREQIFEQYTNVLRTLSGDRPLLLLIDDLHWADTGSIDLFFHLCRRLGHSRVLLVGAYRPADVSAGHADERHPLRRVTNELKRYFGDVWIELDDAGAGEERAVVDAMIDREPNRLGAEFRAALLARTRGHPLFTEELLVALKQGGALIRDSEGRWVEGGTIRWDALPPRVDGLIGERIGRLPEDLKQILEVAAVEGEDFTAETIAGVLKLERREVTRALSRSLDREHRLVGARGVKRLNGDRLSLYRFRHNLFQAYLYDSLDDVERTQHHEDVGQVLATLYRPDLDAVAGQLARHAQLAGQTAVAIAHLQRAGDRARRSFAHDEARDHYESALRLLDTTTDADVAPDARPMLEASLCEGLADVLIVTGLHKQARDTLQLAASAYSEDDRLARARLLRKKGDSLHSQNRWSEALEAFAAAEALLSQVPAGRDHADWWRELIDLRIGVIWARYFLGQADRIARLAEELGPLAERHGTPAQRGAVFHCVTLAAFRRERYAISDATLEMAQQAVGFAGEVGDLLVRVAAQFQLGFCHLWRDEFADAEKQLETSLELAERAGWTWHTILSLTYLAVLHRRRGDVHRCAAFTARALEAAEEADLPVYVGVACANRAWVAWREGGSADAERYGQQAVELWRTHGMYPIQWTALWPLTAVALARDDLPAAILHARSLIDPSQQKLPDGLSRLLESAIAHDADGDTVAARAAIGEAVAGAKELNYL